LRTVWLIAFVILFQPEIRRLLIYVGQSQVVRFFVQVSGTRVIDEVVKATLDLRDRGYGALIVVGRETGLKQWLESGVRLQAEVSTPLLLSIFNPRSPLHDGAVIIQNDIIEAGKCILPLTENIKPGAEYGTRHRAAIGLSEETDAMIIVVSEETGKISLAIAGRLSYDLSGEELKKMLQAGNRYGTVDKPSAV
ncbi:DNA integrity scanning protein DisA nucleotide-binding domain protein, partial [candidate division KSB1 bacterium]|nr:DNA integrity scanning protein DisA nucleotide-binding domain protein [candidate division KSB1 bacterium]